MRRRKKRNRFLKDKLKRETRQGSSAMSTLLQFLIDSSARFSSQYSEASPEINTASLVVYHISERA
jgi:hypothetical protein